MNVQLPSVRRPSSFFDVFSIIAAAVTIMAVILTILHGTFIRLEMAVFAMIVFLWAFWAIERILSKATDRSRRGQNRPWNR